MKHTLKIFLVLGATIAVCLMFNSGVTADTTWVSGTIHTNTTWTPAGNPYIVIGGTRVDTNAILTIQPGVVVEFRAGSGLTIDGGLVARGTASDSIILTWPNSLVFNNSSMDTICFLEYCRIDHSAEGIVFRQASPVVRYCNICNRSGGGGWEGLGSPLEIESGSAPKILYNTISSNGRSSGGPVWGGGIDIRPGSAPEIRGNLIENNSISGGGESGTCWGGGICVASDSAIIVGNIISGNSATVGGYGSVGGGGGIAVVGCAPLISCNEIIGNWAVHIGSYGFCGGGGILIWVPYESSPIITCNTITGNGVSVPGVNAGGIFLYYPGDPVFALNNIYNNHDFINSVFEVYAGWGSTPLRMENNWWGTTDPNMIDLLVYDFWDDPSLREIDYTPFSTSLNTPPSDSIVVISPNGGEEWWSDQTYRIRWNPFCFTDNVKIEYSTNSGYTWENIIGSTRNMGFYSWEVPLAFSSNCRVKVSDVADGIPSDVSDSDFTICPGPTIIVTYPSGGETLRVDSTSHISWNTFCFDGDVKIEYSTNGGGSWTVIVADTTNIGSIAWTVPNTPSPHCRVKISDASDGDPFDLSDSDFIIYSRGDANGDGVINAADVVYLINYLYIGGPAPLPLAAGDVDCDGTINAADVVYLINYLYIHGPTPGC